ncbi:gamma-glutamyl peptidase 5 [Ricinus communis]|uniref:GMP synthase, putative n=1 Tax=Ricinus communis TaxID=3988 RepID=B9T3D8_RICCO|nr:gamma-glutamyl peptidase 5 [Ricinus communis]EEF29614.1 GMP synthase, putative [Ricinus communis]|eukprot:XP_002532757.1 gamma-glutamyl peptidase 5 [Ricinus communis]
MEMGGKKFAVLLCAEDSEYVKKKYGGYFGVFVRMLGEEGETWAVYKVANGEFPDDDEIETFDGFVITGSCNDAHGNDVWICKLLNLLKKLDSKKKKILGICFGHQILARALGGKTGRAVSGWDIGVTAIHFSSSSKLFSSQKTPLSIIECHRDEVRQLPPKAEVMAWSAKTGIEMFKFGDHIMGIQGHPEYTRDILLHLIDRLLQRGLIMDSFADEIKENLDEQEPDREAWRKMCTNFLKSRL